VLLQNTEDIAETNNMPIISGVRTTVRWVKNNPIWSLVGGAASILGLVAGVPPACLAISQALNIPSCVTYSNTYYDSYGHFKKENDNWTEYQANAKLLFAEFSRMRDYITLLNLSPRADPRWATMLVRLPVRGGTAQWTYQNPENWVDLTTVFRTISSAEAEEQANWEKTDNGEK
jgi:hypothetical protein